MEIPIKVGLNKVRVNLMKREMARLNWHKTKYLKNKK